MGARHVEPRVLTRGVGARHVEPRVLTRGVGARHVEPRDSTRGVGARHVEPRDSTRGVGARRSGVPSNSATALEDSRAVRTSRFWCTRTFKYGPHVTVLVHSNLQVRSARHGFGVLEPSSTVRTSRFWCTRWFKYGRRVTVLVHSRVRVRLNRDGFGVLEGSSAVGAWRISRIPWEFRFRGWSGGWRVAWLRGTPRRVWVDLETILAIRLPGYRVHDSHRQ